MWTITKYPANLPCRILRSLSSVRFGFWKSGGIANEKDDFIKMKFIGEYCTQKITVVRRFEIVKHDPTQESDSREMKSCVVIAQTIWNSSD